MNAPIITFDQSNPSLLMIRHQGSMTVEAMERSILVYKRQLEREAHFTIMFDARGAGKPQREAIDALNAFVEQRLVDWGKWCLGIGYALESVLLRMVVRGLFMFNKMPFPYVIRATPDEATRWCQDVLTAREYDAED